jgi:hypothetical protein
MVTGFIFSHSKNSLLRHYRRPPLVFYFALLRLLALIESGG